jgi:hypothetical protein
LASSTAILHCSLSLIFSSHPFTFILFRSLPTSSSHLFLGLPFLLLEYNFSSIILSGIPLSSSLPKWHNHLNLCDLINFTVSSLSSNVFISSFYLILHILFSNTSPYILIIISLSKILSAFPSIQLLVSMKNGVFWDVTPCDSCKNRRFGGT